ncbi:hypothetical protein BJ165DRAFT_1488533 [Panaeolus papilionaceus]|nr:hypothetical protein BJ165DRAFT_1488533 [Panaeolus papilionaceus]
MTPLAPNDTLTPSLPLELFDYIVDVIGWQPSDTPLTVEQTISLQSISLVSKSFVALARTHLLRNVPIDLVGMKKTRLNTLVQLVATKPELSHFIRGILINLDVSQLHDDQVDSTALQRHEQFLLELPRLHAVTVLYPYLDNLEEEPESPDCSKWQLAQFCRNVMGKIALNGTLCILNTTNIKQLPLSIFACSALQSLSIEDGRLVSPTALQRSDSLTKLSLIEMNVPISVLSYFPNLEELYLLWTNLLPSQALSSSPPSLPFGLKNLTYRCGLGNTTSLSLISTIFRHQASKLGTQPFRFLRTITLEFEENTRCVAGIWELLEDTIVLQDLNIQVRGKHWLTSSLIVELNANQHLERVCRHLHNLRVIFIERESNEKGTLMKNLQILLASFPSDNELAHIHLTLRGRLVQGFEEKLDLEPWPSLVCILARCSTFRKLETVNMVLETTLDTDVMRTEVGASSSHLTEFSKRMGTVIEHLQTRCNVSLSYETRINEGSRYQYMALITFTPNDHVFQ